MVYRTAAETYTVQIIIERRNFTPVLNPVTIDHFPGPRPGTRPRPLAVDCYRIRNTRILFRTLKYDDTIVLYLFIGPEIANT
jgi:hypothetical protein